MSKLDTDGFFSPSTSTPASDILCSVWWGRTRVILSPCSHAATPIFNDRMVRTERHDYPLCMPAESSRSPIFMSSVSHPTFNCSVLAVNQARSDSNYPTSTDAAWSAIEYSSPARTRSSNQRTLAILGSSSASLVVSGQRCVSNVKRSHKLQLAL